MKELYDSAVECSKMGEQNVDDEERSGRPSVVSDDDLAKSVDQKI